MQSTLEVDVDLVSVFVTVHDTDGAYVPGLDSRDFQVFEDGELQPIEVFERGDGVPSSLGILIDDSGSSADILAAVRSGVQDFAAGLDPDDEIFVMSFGTEVRVIHDLGDDLSGLRSSLSALRAWGTSVFYDALDSGIRKLAGTNARQALIVLTDGDDNGSERTWIEIVRAAESRMVILYFVGMGPPILVDTYTLRGLASMTGGRVYLMSGDDSPRNVLDAVRREMSYQYYLAYYSSPGPGYHSIRVAIPGTEFTARAREGYLVLAE
jgi:VWFA-related protein